MIKNILKIIIKYYKNNKNMKESYKNIIKIY